MFKILKADIFLYIFFDIIYSDTEAAFRNVRDNKAFIRMKSGAIIFSIIGTPKPIIIMTVKF